MFKNIALVLPAALLAATTVMAQCTNYACQAANAIYQECKYSTFGTDDFQKCLCTDKFLVNYKRCVGGHVCAWDGDPATLGYPCIAVYCPGSFAGGFDANAFCRGNITFGYPSSTSTSKTSTTTTTSKSISVIKTTSTIRSTSTSRRPVITYFAPTYPPPPDA
ncbi:hypothetical protein FRC17_005963 [Serendipita sp. 399]|nr:hypothetical protein FRC17_005963 [Serendipita sp. 399]